MKFNKESQDYKKLNNFIRNEMRDQKVSQSDLAYSLNLSQGSVSQKLSGQIEWTMWEILNVFSLLNVDFEYERRTDGKN
ncbi:MAG: helix-turn-helix transcriptional regulator [Bacteroidales bacterium]|nr:helix-turn-helix transcriptional regulator [Bacteroidales bacterium]